MHVFNGPDRVGWWVNDPSDSSTLDANRLREIAGFAGGMITDVFAPPTISTSQVTAITKTAAAVVGTLRFQLRDQPIKLGGTPSEEPERFAQRSSDAIGRRAEPARSTGTSSSPTTSSPTICGRRSISSAVR
jgi:hypothetical protein